MRTTTRRAIPLTAISLTAVFAILVAGCGDAETGPEAEPSSTSSAAAPTAPTTSSSPAPVVEGIPSALDDRSHPDFPEPLVDPDRIFPGGPPPDGIPPIDAPSFVSVAEADAYLLDAEPVVLLEIDGDARAYPVQVLVWHEIVNDVVGGVPVSVTYCPLCNSAVSYRREVAGEVTTFGTSGLLYQSALVMYDRATESLWTHFDGRAVVGARAGVELEPIGSPLLAWADFKSSHPGGRVLDRDATGHNRAYGTNPYTGYDNPDGVPFLFRGGADDRARAMQRVVGITMGDESVAISLDALVDQAGFAVLPLTVGGRDLIVLWAAGQASALEASGIAEGRDIGSVGVFVAELDGEPISLEAGEAGFTDTSTGSTWTVTGAAVAGPAAGRQLERIPHLDTFWFAWSTYRSGTSLLESEPDV